MIDVISLETPQWKFLSSADMDLGVLLESPQGGSVLFSSGGVHVREPLEL